jgi:hypothetical protein
MQSIKNSTSHVKPPSTNNSDLGKELLAYPRIEETALAIFSRDSPAGTESQKPF